MRSIGSGGDDSRLTSGGDSLDRLHDATTMTLGSLPPTPTPPEDDDDPFDDELDDDLDDSLQDRASTISGRGALIRGLNISGSSTTSSSSRANDSKRNVDVESALQPPDSDYAPYIPPMLFPSLSSAASTPRSRRKTKQKKRNEGPVKRNNGTAIGTPSSIWSGGSSSSSWDEKLKRPFLWYILACVSILMIIAVIALSVVLTSKRHTDPMTERQRELSDVISLLTSEDSFLDASSPQAKAHNWIVFNDSVSLNEMDRIGKDRVIQRFVLAVFYFATNGPSSWGENDWLNGHECGASGNWTGVSCDDNSNIKGITLGMCVACDLFDGTVSILTIAIVTDNFGLEGFIPIELGHLADLTHFVLQNNGPGLSGTVPASIGKLPLLRQLSLPNNNIVGTIPDELFLASSLSYINLEGNTLEGTLSSELSRLSNLKTLILSNNNLEGLVPFDNLADTRIEYLGLSSNKFKGAINDSIRDCRELKYLYLDRNEMGGVLPMALGEVSNLRSLNLDLNRFAGRIPAILGRLRKLEFLSMQSNSFIGSLPGEINLLTSLRTLNLVANDLTGNLPGLSALTNLNNLLLVGNRLHGTIPENFQSLTSLGTYVCYFVVNAKFVCSPSANLRNSISEFE